MEWLKINYHLLSAGYLGLVITAAHLVAAKQYSWSQNSISELGAQGYSRSWIMRMGFIGFGLIMIVGILLKLAGGDALYLVDIPIMLYAVAIMFTGFFSTEPFLEQKHYSQTSDLLHSIFTMAAGGAMSIALLMSALLATSTRLRTVHIVFLILITLISALLGFRKKHSGVIQRVLYIVSFLWLIGFYNM